YDTQDNRSARCTAVDLAPRALVTRDAAHEVELIAGLAGNGHDLIPRLQNALGGRVRLDLTDPRGQLGCPKREAEEQYEGKCDVHHRPGADHHDSLPDRLVVVAARSDFRRKFLLRVHPGDLHVAAEGYGADPVLGLTAAYLEEQGREEQHESLHAHAGLLG